MNRLRFVSLRRASCVAALIVLALTLPACDVLFPVAETPPEPLAAATSAGSGGGVVAPIVTPAPTDLPPTPVQASGVSYGGIAFTYPPSVASDILAETVPREEVPDGEGPFWASTPEYVAFTFEGYPVTGSIHTPTIYVYPAAEFEQANTFAGDVIGGLRDMLDARPDELPDPIPFLPIFNAAQMFHTHFTYLDFTSGSGARFVTHFSQAPIVVANDNLLYTFQGITADGEWVVSAVLPIANPILPDSGDEPPDGDWNAFAENYSEYLPALVEELAAQPAASFTPGLDALDETIASIRIE